MLCRASNSCPQGRFDFAGLNGFSQLLQETEHFWGWRQEKVAKIVPYAPPLAFHRIVLQGRRLQMVGPMDWTVLVCSGHKLATTAIGALIICGEQARP